jgi:lysophospholipase
LEPAPLYTDVARGPEAGAAFWLRADDGVRLRLGLWARGRRGTVLLLPGRTEVIEKYGQVASDLASAGYGVLTIDWRGQGLSDRLAADPMLGHVRRFADYQLDLAAMLGAADRLDLLAPRFVLAHSMGGCIALRGLVDGCIAAHAAAFSAPMWGLPISTGQRIAARAAGAVARTVRRDRIAVPGPAETYDLSRMAFSGNALTSDRTMFAYMQAQVQAHPDLALGAPTLGWLAAALREMRALARRPAPALPTLAAIGSREEIVEPAAVEIRMAQWPAGRFERLEGARHEIMMEAPHHRLRFLQMTLDLFASAGRAGDGAETA